MSKSKEEPGNAMGSALALQRMLLRIGDRVAKADMTFSSAETRGLSVYAIKLRRPEYEGGEWLAILQGTCEGKRVVAFHSGETFDATLTGLLARVENGSIKLQEDKYGQGQ